MAASFTDSRNTSRRAVTRKLVPYRQACPGSARKCASRGVCADAQAPTSVQAVGGSPYENSGRWCSMRRVKVPRATAATVIVTATPTATWRAHDAGRPASAPERCASTSAHTRYTVARNSTGHSTREVCSCTARATRAAMKGSETANTASRTSAPTNRPRSSACTSPRRARTLNTMTSTAGAMALVIHVEAPQSLVGNR